MEAKVAIFGMLAKSIKEAANVLFQVPFVVVEDHEEGSLISQRIWLLVELWRIRRLRQVPSILWSDAMHMLL